MLAEAEKIDTSYLTRMLQPRPLAPESVEALLDRRQPKGITLKTALESLPPEWARQSFGWAALSEFSVPFSVVWN